MIVAAALVPALLSAIALYCTLDALRWRESARAMRSFGFTAVFVALTIVAVWVGMHNPYGVKVNNGFGPQWRCAHVVRGDFCIRDQRTADVGVRR